MKIAVQITDVNLNPGINSPPYCIGRDRGGRIYSPIWFTDTYIPAQFSLHWIESLGRRWTLGPPLIGQAALDGLGIGDKRISVENLWLIANDTVHISAGNNDSIDVHDTRIRNVPLCTEDDEAANKAYVDSVAPIGAPHSANHETGGIDEVYFSQLEHSNADPTLHDALTSTPHVSATEKSNLGTAYSHSQDGTIHLSAAQKTDLTDGNDCSSHKHDDRYYTELESDGKYSIIGHTHWSVEEVTAASKSMAVNYIYIANRGTLITFTLPAAASQGDMILLRGKGAGGWKIAQNAGQTIHFLGVDTTTGAVGYLASTLTYDCIGLMCITANTDWVVTDVMGNITIV